MGVMCGRWLCTLSSFFVTTSSINVVRLTQRRFPGRSASIAKWTRRQSRTVEENRISTFFFLFLHPQKQAAGVDLQCWIGASACHCLFSAFNLAFKSQSISAMNRLQPHACTSCLLLGLVRDHAMTCSTLLEICSFLQATQRDRSTIALFFFTVDRTTNRVQTPSLPYESSFVCPRYANLWDDPLTAIFRKNMFEFGLQMSIISLFGSLQHKRLAAYKPFQEVEHPEGTFPWVYYIALNKLDYLWMTQFAAFQSQTISFGNKKSSVLGKAVLHKPVRRSVESRELKPCLDPQVL